MLYPFGAYCILTVTILASNIYRIGVGSDVVCSTLIGSARASTRGTDNMKFHAFFMPVYNPLYFTNIKTKKRDIGKYKNPQIKIR